MPISGGSSKGKKAKYLLKRKPDMPGTEDIYTWLQLINSKGIGPVLFNKLLQQYGSAAAALHALPPERRIFSRADAEKEIETADKLGVKILLSSDSQYPQKLKKIYDAPPILYAAGNLALLNHAPAVAIVGTRNATLNGRKLTSRIAYELTNANVLIISGMARGIDTAAHKGAMYAKQQAGPTIAVLGTGIDKIYPPENAEIYNQILQQGLLLSELPLGTNAQTGNFPRRNRIISGLADAVLVAEATHHSGSLITAQQAIAQGKKIFAIPGSPSEARADGPNLLLRHGAGWAEKAEDILRLLPQPQSPLIGLFKNEESTNLFTKPLDILQKTVDIPSGEASASLIQYLSAEAVEIDEIIRNSGLSAAEAAAELTGLELEGKIIRLPGNRVALRNLKMKEKR